MNITVIFKKVVTICTYFSFLLANTCILLLFNSNLKITDNSIYLAILTIGFGIILSATVIYPMWFLRAIKLYKSKNEIKQRIFLDRIYLIIIFVVFSLLFKRYFQLDYWTYLYIEVILFSVFIVGFCSPTYVAIKKISHLPKSSLNLLKTLFAVWGQIQHYFPDLIKFILLSIRYLFFSILNDIFILNIFWVSYLFAVYSFKIISLPVDFDIVVFVAPITLIGILSGLFMVYMESYKQQINSNAVKPMAQYVQDFVQDVTPRDFLDYLDTIKDVNYKLIYELRSDFDEFIHDKGSLSKELRKSLHIAGMRSPSNVTINNIPMPYKIQPINMFILFDYFVKDTNKEYIELLNSCYKDYFTQKLLEFKNQLYEYDFEETRNLLFSGVFFLNELDTDITTINEPYKKHKRETRNFMDCYNKFVRQCAFDLMSHIMNDNFSDDVEIIIDEL